MNEIIIPATAGQTGYILEYDPDSDPHIAPMERDIIAWRITDRGACPIFAGFTFKPGMVGLIMNADGSCENMETMQWYGNLDDAVLTVEQEWETARSGTSDE